MVTVRAHTFLSTNTREYQVFSGGHYTQILLTTSLRYLGTARLLAQASVVLARHSPAEKLDLSMYKHMLYLKA